MSSSLWKTASVRKQPWKDFAERSKREFLWMLGRSEGRCGTYMEDINMYVIMYHYIRKIRGSRYTHIKGLELEDFKRQIRFLQENRFEFVSLEDVITGNRITDKSVLLTFDDGYIDHYLNAFPILEQNNIKGVFSMPAKILRERKALDVNKIHYILACTEIIKLREKLFKQLDYYRGIEFEYPSNQELYSELAIADRFDNKDTIFVKRLLQHGLPEKLRMIITKELFEEFVTDREAAFVEELYMNFDQIKMMKRHGMEFAIHGYDHYWMDYLNEIDLIEDITKALDVFDGIIDSHDWCCCYPYGGYNDEVIQKAKSLGAASGLTIDVSVYHPDQDDLYKIPRLDTNDFPPKSENYLQFN